MKRNFFSDKTKKKIKDKRLYIVLACCVLSICAVYFANSVGKVENEPTENKRSDVEYSLPKPLETKQPASEKIVNESDGTKKDLNEKTNLKEDEKKEKNVENKKTESVASTDAKNENTEDEKSFSYPADGDILLGYSNKPAYSEIFGDWRTHEGIDIAAELNGDVAAAADGKVYKIFDDAVYGMTIVIEHDNNIKTLYSNISDTNSLKEGDIVSKGDIIAHVGETAIGEKYDRAHIHFEVMADGKNENPYKFLN